jgi:hypothetical protein
MMLSRISSMLNPFSMLLIIWIPELPKISIKTRLLSLLLQVLEGRGGRCGRRTPRGPWRSAKFLANRKFFLQKKDK